MVGGYGVVGHLVAGFVAGHWPGRTLLIAGRDLGRATDAARAFADARALRLDLEDSSTWDRALAEAGAVVVTAEAPEAFAQSCLERGLAYVDVTPTPTRVRALLSLDEKARRGGGHGRVGVGAAPGLSTALTVELAAGRSASSVTQIIDLHVADEYGPEARAWSNQAAQRLSAGQRRPSVDAVPSRFADRELLASYLDGAEVTTFVRLLPRPSGVFLRLVARSARVRRLVERPGAERPLAFVKQRPRRFALSVQVRDGNRVVAEARLSGQGQARVTAAMAVLALEDAEAGAAGVAPLHESMSSSQMISGLERLGVAISR